MATTPIGSKRFEPKSFTVSATTYNAALTDFHVPPTGQRKRGYGFQYFYTLESKEDYDALIDRLAITAADLADEHGADHPAVQDIYKQMEHI